MAFQNQKDGILTFYETVNEVVDQHKQTYGKLVTKLNEKSGLTQTLTNNLDSFMGHSFPEFSTFKKGIESQPLEDASIKYVYDINKNEYVTNFTLPDKKIVVKQHFTCVLMKNGSNICTLLNGQPWTTLNNYLNNSLQKSTVTYTSRNYMPCHTGVIEHNAESITKKKCNCDNLHCGCQGGFITQVLRASSTYRKKETKELEVYIDDYLNIFIPKLKTYLVFNYSKFPLYSFFVNMDKLNLYHNQIEGSIRSLMFNEDCPNDLKEYNLLKSFVDVAGDYAKSQDTRNNYKTLFPNLLTFYQYNKKQSFFSQYQNLAEKLEQLSPSASIKVVVEDEDTMNDEKKIFSQSQRIRELEIINQKQNEEIEYLRTERTQYIEKEHNSSSELAEYRKLLEELNTQLHDEIDNVSIKQKEVIRLKTVNLEYSDIRNQYRRLEDVCDSHKTKLNILEDKLSKIKILNSTLVDKQMESHQKLELERNNSKDNLNHIKKLKIQNVDFNVKIKELETVLECEKEQHIISKHKVDEMIGSISKSETIIDDQYQEILLSQLKEKNDEIKQIHALNSKLTIENKTSHKAFSLLKSQVSALLND
jgi:hypothetical protein